MSARPIVIYCGLLMTLSASSVDIILPAFSQISKTLPAPYDQVQLTITVFLIAIGVGQLFSGSLSDRFGRKIVVMVGLSIYFLGTLVCYYSKQIEWLLIGRAIQGLGVSAGPVVSRAILRDLFEGQQLARNMALATGVFALGPIVAPLVGAVILEYSTWPSIFLWMLVTAGFMMMYCAFRLPETNLNKNPRATKLAEIWKNVRSVLDNPTSRFYLFISTFVYSLMIIILTSIPRVFDETFDIRGTQFALLFAIHGIGIIIGQVINGKMISKFGAVSSLLIGNVVLVIACAIMAAGALMEALDAFSTVAVIVLFATSFLIVLANLTAIILSNHGNIAGFASSFFGFYSQVTGSSVAIAMQYVIEGSLTLLAVSLLAITSAILCAVFIHTKYASTQS